MTSKETPAQQTLTLLRERGKDALKIAKQSVQQEKIGYKPIQEALDYFMVCFRYIAKRLGASMTKPQGWALPWFCSWEPPTYMMT
jgi:hypothetical protein